MSWLSKLLKLFHRGEPTPADRLARAGELAIAEAVRLWKLDVYDPPYGDSRPRAKFCLEVINDIIRRAGWGWVTYKGNGPPQWCGLFAAACWRTAGIDPGWLATFWASTLRLSYWVCYRAWNKTPAGAPSANGSRQWLRVERDMPIDEMRFRDGTAPRAGDIVIVGDGTPAEGDHITLLVELDATGTFHTISGNGGGVGPDGRRREGIVKTDYRADAERGYRVLWVYRPGVDDLL